MKRIVKLILHFEFPVKSPILKLFLGFFLQKVIKKAIFKVLLS